LVYGESAVKVKGGSFGEDYKYNAWEIRFTTKGSALYAFALGWPEDRKLTIRSLAKPAGSSINRIEQVGLLGYDGKLAWQQTPEGLTVTLPERKVSEYTAALKITGSALTNVPFAPMVTVISADAHGKIILSPETADLNGKVQVEQKGGQPNFGFWDDPADSVSWTVRFPAAGKYSVRTACATVHGDVPFVIEIAGQMVNGVATNTGSWDQFAAVNLGTVTVEAPGQVQVRVRSQDPARWQAINLRAITLIRE
jgi:alpha-L-fucosidase